MININNLPTWGDREELNINSNLSSSNTQPEMSLIANSFSKAADYFGDTRALNYEIRNYALQFKDQPLVPDLLALEFYLGDPQKFLGLVNEMTADWLIQQTFWTFDECFAQEIV